MKSIKSCLEAEAHRHPMIKAAPPLSIYKTEYKALAPLLMVALLLGLFSASMVIAIMLAWVFNALIPLIVSETMLETPLWEALDASLNLIIFFIGLHIVVFLWVRYKEKRAFGSIGLDGRRRLLKFGFGFALACISMGMVAGLIVWAGKGSIDTESAQLVGVSALPFVLILLLGWSVQASAEEVLFQGWFMPKASTMFGPIFGILLTAMMFMAFHAFNPGMRLLPIINLMLYGTFAALYVLYEGGIMGIIGYHIAWNWSQGNVFGLSVSGTSGSTMTLVKVTVNEPNLLTGGAFGPEGGLIVTGILLVSIIGVMVLLIRRSRLKDV